MWLQFALSVVFLSALLLLPGFLFITALAKNATTSTLAVAPAISVAFYAIAGLVVGTLGTLGLPASLAVCLLPLLAPLICILVQTVRLKTKIKSSLSIQEMTYPCLYIVISTVVVGTFFIMNLDGPDATSRTLARFSRWRTMGITLSCGPHLII